jgi:hypothetical protein
MEQVSLDNIYREIMLLSNFDQYKLYHLMEKNLYQDKHVVAYTTSGTPLLQEQYIEKIERALAEAGRNELITDDDLEKEIATW